MEKSQPSTSKEEEPIEVTCRGCGVAHPIKSIMIHIARSECKKSYSKEQELSLRKYSKEISSIKKAKLEKQKKKEIADRNSRTYQLKKDIIKEKYQKNRQQIAEVYQNKKVEIAIKNRKKRWDTAKKYDKVKRAKKYKEQRKQIAKKYKDDQEKMESNEGKQFMKIFDKASSDYYCKLRQELYEIASDNIFESMDHSSRYFTKFDFDQIHEKAERTSDREWAFAVSNPWGIGRAWFLPGKSIYIGAEERSLTKAFDTLFDERFSSLYEDVYDNAMDITVSSDLFWNDENDSLFVNQEKMDKLFSSNFEKEMDTCMGIEDLPKMISDIIKEESNVAMKKRFAEFKVDTRDRIRGHNYSRKKWASDRLEEMKEKFEKTGWTDE